jgi:hypothetical protein
MLVTRLVLVICALAAACTSPSQESRVAEAPDLVVSGSCSHHEDVLTLAVAVTNRGRGAATPAAARVEFNGDPASGEVRRTHFIAARAVETFEVELPALCTKAACGWSVTVDAPKPVHESGRC